MENVRSRAANRSDLAMAILVNVFTLDKADEEIFLDASQDDARFTKQLPGFISTQLYRAIGETPTYLNYAVWTRWLNFVRHFRIRCSEQSCLPTPVCPSPVIGQTAISARPDIDIDMRGIPPTPFKAPPPIIPPCNVISWRTTVAMSGSKGLQASASLRQGYFAGLCC